MKELEDPETTALIETLGQTAVLWLDGTAKAARAWREAHGFEGPLAVLPADAETLAGWRLDRNAANTVVYVGGNRVRAVVVNARRDTVLAEIERRTAQTQSPEAIMLRLTAASDGMRRNAALDLQRLDETVSAPLVPRLVAMLRDESPTVRRGAAEALSVSLARAAPEPVVAALLARLEDVSPAVRERTARTLGGYREHRDLILPALLARMGAEPKARVRASMIGTAAGITTRCRAVDALALLTAGLGDASESVRLAAASAVQQLYGPARRGD